jgi:membrane-associated phospholipid phosphatase
MATEVTQTPPPEPDAGHTLPLWRRRAPLIAAVLYVVATVVVVAVRGKILLSRDVVLIWLMGGLLILSINNPGRWVRGMVFDWLPFVLFLFAYDYARSIADETGFTPHLAPQLKVERFLFGTPLPTTGLQEHFYHPPAAAWYDYTAWGVYLTHFFGTLTLAVILWRFAYPLFKRWRTLVIGLSTAGFATYVLYPAVPPWLASNEGKIGHVDKIKDQMFDHTGTKAITSAVEKNWVDKTAAMPSLHSAFPLMMMLLFWHKGWKWRIPFGLYALAMGTALVYTGEHFVVDVFAGWAYALIVYFLASRFWRWRERRDAEREEAKGVGHPPASVAGAPAASEPEPAVSYSAGGAPSPPE